MPRKNAKGKMDRPKIPDKIYYSIREVSEYTDVQPHVLRYWETKFSRLSPERAAGNQRRYTKADLELIFEIKDLLHNQGFTLSGAEQQMKGGGRKRGRGSASPAEPPAKATPPPSSPAPAAPASEARPIREALPQAKAQVARQVNGQLSEIRRELHQILEMVNS